MRKRTILGLTAVGIAIAVVYRRWSGLQVPERAREVSPIGEPISDDEPIDREELPTDVSEEGISASVDQGTETLPGDEAGTTRGERASKDPDRSVDEDAENVTGSTDTSGTESDAEATTESTDESANESRSEDESAATGEE